MGKVKRDTEARTRFALIAIWILLGALFALGFYYTFSWALADDDAQFVRGMVIHHQPPPPTLDKHLYDRLMYKLANYPAASTTVSTSTSLASTTWSKPIASSTRPWPVATAPYPNYGALLPFYRIVAYYGNFYSTGMGVLGQYPEDQMLAKLDATVKEWQAADPNTPVMPAIHYIVSTAQGTPQKDGSYSLLMPDDQIDYALELANKIHGVVFLDFQVGKSTVQRELPLYEKYVAMPNVHIGVDPEFSMKDGAPPGKEIGTLDATDINWVIQYMDGIVKENKLPPKILVIHRFTEDMVTNTSLIKPTPNVQFVMDMDGWGTQEKKYGTYTNVVAAEPVQFTGFKLFYKNDNLPPSTGMLTPAQVLKLTPAPIYIQYQ
jgi:hypothetical protein